jgi:hypothetical protein
MDYSLIIILCVSIVLLLAISLYIFALYCNAEDSEFGSSYWCKFVVIIGMALSWGTILMLPLDVANSRG